MWPANKTYIKKHIKMVVYYTSAWNIVNSETMSSQVEWMNEPKKKVEEQSQAKAKCGIINKLGGQCVRV